jgi:hypothetical protein
VLAATAARDRLDEQIMVVVVSPRFANPVNRLGCLRGISALTGMALRSRLATGLGSPDHQSAPTSTVSPQRQDYCGSRSTIMPTFPLCRPETKGAVG